MKKVRKKLFTLSGLFMVLAQVFVAAFCGITAVAVTQGETTKTLYENTHGVATMGYELTENGQIEWTLSLNKGEQQTATRLMVELMANGVAIVPENIRSTNAAMTFDSNYGDEYIQGGVSEVTPGSSSGQTIITFETSRDITSLVATPKLITVPVADETVTITATDTSDENAEIQPVVDNEPVNLLEDVPGVNFEIPAVVEEVVEESTSADSQTSTINEETVISESEVTEKVVTENTEEETTITENTITETTDALEEVDDEVTSIEDPVGRAQYQGFVSLTGAQLLADPLDPFKYSTDGEGTYPTHHSNSYSHSGADINTSTNIRNYNYGLTTGKTDDVAIYNIGNGALNLKTGYHEYGSEEAGRINTKKTVSPTADPNVFQVQLDTIGDAIKINEKADIVLVLDKSASMRDTSGGSTRWAQLKSAVTSFANDLLADTGTDVQIGLVGFYSVGTILGTSARADVATFGTSEFTSSAAAVTGHGLVTETPPEDRGTPTFIGVDAGVNLLHNGSGARSNAQKIMITITDGEPTYRPGSNYAFSSITPTTVSGNMKRYSTTQMNGDGQNDQSSANITHITAVYGNYPNTVTGTKPATSFYSVGFHTGATANSVVTALGREGAYAASNVTSLVIALKNAVAGLINTIANATLTDPMSEYVTLDASSVTTTGLYLNNGVLSIANAGEEFISGFQVNPEGNQITVNNVTLGSDTNGRQGYRITYKVTLNTAYRDGAFYPVNKTTYLANGEKGNHYYAIPSVRVAPTPVTVSFTKTNGNELLAGARFTLTGIDNPDNIYTSTITDETGKVTFTEVMPGKYMLEETETPVGHVTMEPIEVEVDLTGKITFADGTDLTTVTNTLKRIDLSLNKVGQDGEALAGATFVLRDSEEKDAALVESNTTVGLHELFDIAPGTYKLIETGAPNGYKVLGEIGTLTIDKYGAAIFEKVNDSNQTITLSRVEDETIAINLSSVKNELKEFDLTVFKEDDTGNALVGAEFTLTGTDGYKQVITSSEAEAISTFVFEDLKSGTYTLTETSSPEGYVGLSESITIEISDLGVVTVTGTEAISELTPEVANNTISFTVTNKKKVPLPATGGTGTMMFVTIGVLALTATGLYFLQRKDREVA